jgi:hypothetical protein
MSPSFVQRPDFLMRAGMMCINTASPTCISKRSRTIRDYFLASSTLASAIEKVAIPSGFQLRPHLPVMVSFDGLEDEMIPVFCKPPKLPVRRPYGPSREEADWSHLEDASSAGGVV